MTKLVALYKTFDGGEFVDASLESIYNHCDQIVMVHSDVSWLGERGNTVRSLAMEWCEEHDKENKAIHLDCELKTQEGQYALGVDYIDRHKIPFDAIMAVDADEVWEDQYIENAKRQIHDNHSPAYRSNMHTYLKNPFFQVDPPYGSPTVFFREPKHLTKSPRGCKAPAKHLSDVWMHHYTYVRETRADVERKLKQSCLADGNEVVVDGWMENVYDNMPEGRDLHAFERWKRVWVRIKKIWKSDMPEAMRSARLLKNWLPDGHLLDGEANEIHRLADGMNQAVDLGTYKGYSASILALACRKVHTVDIYDDIGDSFADTLQPDRYQGMQDHSLEATRALSARYGNMTCEKNNTWLAADDWGQRSRDPVDFLFVDADHSEIATRWNVACWLKHMRPGSRIVLHDNNDIHPGVQAVVREMESSKTYKKLDTVEYSGSLVAFEVA